MTEDSGTAASRSKVARVVEKYGLKGMGERLERYWRGDGAPRQSLRELADYFNQSVLDAAMRNVGLQPLEGEAENLYRLVTGDDVSAGQRAEAEAKLERNGVDVGQVRSDFVSHQAVHTYLTSHREVDSPTSADEDRPASARERIQRTRGRLSSVIESSLSNLESGGDITLGTFNVFVTTQVYCEDCEHQFAVTELLDRGGCDCE